jgi:hypothetical protein
MQAPSIRQSPILFAIGVSAALTVFGSAEAPGHASYRVRRLAPPFHAAMDAKLAQ